MQRILPLAVVIVCTAILIGLGTWQMQRLAWKEGLIAEREAGLSMPVAELPAAVDDWAHFDFRMVRLVGTFRYDLEQVFSVEARGSTLGHYLLTPFIHNGGQAILVNRGWIPADKIDPATREAGQYRGTTTLNGVARYRLDDRPGWFTPANEPAAGLWYYYDLPAMETALGIELAPLVVKADATPNPGGFPIGSRTEIRLTNNHLQYAITWYALAVGLIGVYIAFLRQTRRTAYGNQSS